MHNGSSGEKQPVEGKLDVQRYIALFWDNIYIFCFIVLCVSVCGFFVSYALPKRYQALSTVSIEQNVVSDLVKGIAITPSVTAKMRLLSVHLLSRDLLAKVAAKLDMDLLYTTPSRKEMLIQSLRANIRISHDEKKGLFTISYTNSNPVLARNFVNTLTQLYIEESTAAKREESFAATDFLSEQIKVFQKRIDEAQFEIDAFKSAKGMYLGLNEQLLRQQIKDNEQRRESLQIRKNELTAKLNFLLEQKRDQYRDQVRALELQLQSLRSVYTDRHPSVVRMTDEIAHLRKLARQESKDEVDDVKNSLEYQTLQVELHSLEEMERNLLLAWDKDMKELQQLPSIRTQLAELQQRKNNETSIYEQLVSRFGQSEVAKQMELQDKAVTFNVIDAAVTPTKHIFPLRYLYILGSIAGGCALALGLILGNDILRGKVRSIHDLRKFDVKVLTKVPNLVPLGFVKLRKRKILLAAFTAGVVLCLCLAAAMEFFEIYYIEKGISLIRRTLFS